MFYSRKKKSSQRVGFLLKPGSCYPIHFLSLRNELLLFFLAHMNMIALSSSFCHQLLQEFAALLPLKVYIEIYPVRKTLQQELGLHVVGSWGSQYKQTSINKSLIYNSSDVCCQGEKKKEKSLLLFHILLISWTISLVCCQSVFNFSLCLCSTAFIVICQ